MGFIYGKEKPLKSDKEIVNCKQTEKSIIAERKIKLWQKKMQR